MYRSYEIWRYDYWSCRSTRSLRKLSVTNDHDTNNGYYADKIIVFSVG